MAYAGVVCGNCNGVGFNEDRAFESIFSPLNDEDLFDGQCAKYKTSEEGLGKDYSKMMCSKGIWCPNGYNGGDNCKFHCDNFGLNNAEGNDYDEGCGDYPDFPRELCTESGKCFYAPEGQKNWADAEADCSETYGATLASVLSEAENEIVKRLARNVGGEVWIGFNDILTEGTFVWADGAASDAFTNWNSNEPNDFQGNEDCAELHGDNGLWNDDTCTNQVHYVCSKAAPFTDTEEPARRLLAAGAGAPEAITLDTAFDWGHVISDVKAAGWANKKPRRTL
eukprot:263360-Rhodomonas_salina.1